MITKSIDPARSGLSKSLMTNPCERKGFYSETVRDAEGRRLSVPLPERVTFGTAVDEAVTWLLWSIRADELDFAIDDILNDPEVGDTIANDMRIVGMEAARKALGWPLVPDEAVFNKQLTLACRKYLNAEDGLIRILPLLGEGLRLQGNDGESLRAGDVIGTPDFLTDRRVGDLKTWGRRAGESKVWESPEMGIYAYLFAAQSGALPETVFYQAYVRTAAPYWLWIEVPVTADLVAYGRATIDHWSALIDSGDARMASVNTRFCGDCPFRMPLPDLGHDGCTVGRHVPAEEVGE